MLRRAIDLLAATLVAHFSVAPAFAQTPPTVSELAAAQTFNAAQLDALLAPIALYPDQLLT